MLDQFSLAHRPAGVHQQIFQQGGLFRGEGQGAALRAHPAGGGVQHQRAAGQLPALLHRAAAQQRPHPGQKLGKMEGLGHIVVGAPVQPGDLVLQVRPGGLIFVIF